MNFFPPGPEPLAPLVLRFSASTVSGIHPANKMLSISVALLALATAGLAAVPSGYRQVVITSNVNSTFVVVPKTVTNGSGIVVQTRASGSAQSWYLQSGNSSIIYGADTTLCLDAGAKSNWKDMATVYLQSCSATTGNAQQTWNVMADGRIALAASTPQECLDLQYMRAVVNNPVGLYNCAGLGNIGAADTGINWPLVDVAA